MAAYGFRWLRVIGRNYGPIIVVTLAALLCAQAFNGRPQEAGRPWRIRSDITPRTMASQELVKYGGRHLILVRYSPAHIATDECVYNAADIDASQIVWALDMGEPKNRELINYYKNDRQVWLYQPDSDPGRLIRYESVSH